MRGSKGVREGQGRLQLPRSVQAVECGASSTSRPRLPATHPPLPLQVVMPNITIRKLETFVQELFESR